ncbi:MAG: hypothetical protein CMN05_14910 [Roseibacillus sp.]|nr:hypothetical protein [Roseibacillus sp.]
MFLKLMRMALATVLVLTCGVPAMAAKTVFATAAAENEDPFAAGKAAATRLKAKMGNVAPKAVIVVDCFEDKPNKQKMIDGVASVLDREILCGGSVYGAFTQDGTLDLDAVTLLGIGGTGVDARMALVDKMGTTGLSMEKDEKKLSTALNAAGARLAKSLAGSKGSMMILMGDAHSPKNQFLIGGVQSVLGKTLPITGGSINKNAGQNWLYYQGALYNDAAFALMLKGDFKVAQTGRQAKSNDAVIATAREGSAAALKKLAATPQMVFAYNCAGRMGKLKKVGDELTAIKSSLGNESVVFGCYCAGEFGPADAANIKDDGVSYGRGWHVMFTLIK